MAFPDPADISEDITSMHAVGAALERPYSFILHLCHENEIILEAMVSRPSFSPISTLTILCPFALFGRLALSYT